MRSVVPQSAIATDPHIAFTPHSCGVQAPMQNDEMQCQP